MTPAATAAARREAAQRPVPAPGRPASPDRRPPLRVVGDRPRPKVRRRRAATIFSLALVVGSLLTVVVGHAMLAEGQVRLSAVQSALTTEQAAHRQDVLSAAGLETPTRIVSQAHQQGMTMPAQIDQLPYVSLNTPLPTPNVAPAPPPTTPTTTPATASTASGQ